MTTHFILFADWSTRVKQIAKLWRKASSQDRAPYVVRSLAKVALCSAPRRSDRISWHFKDLRLYQPVISRLIGPHYEG